MSFNLFGRLFEMNLKTLRIPLALTVAILSLASLCSAQNDYGIVPIIARDNGTGVGACTLGVSTGATYCNDGTVTPGGFIEEELPPKPPTGVFDFRATDHRSSGACLGTGQRVHMQETAKLDTFKVDFQPGDGGYPFTLSWGAHADWIASDWATLIIQDAFGGFLINVNMKTDTSVLVSNPAITTLNIIGTSNAAGTLDVDRDGDRIPQRFALEQNYPNPFNPSTTIRFAVEKAAFTDVAIYNVIGQKVRTLAADLLTPGFYTTTWNGTDDNGTPVTTGIYYVRMVASGENADFNALRKLLFLK
jgi:hypothetical protein